jgi:peptidoglycan pentaglycine glycine transferase (the first glycine)
MSRIDENEKQEVCQGISPWHSNVMRIVKECEQSRWNALIESSQTGYITQMWEWGQLSHLGTMHRLAIADDTGAYIAATSLIETRAPLINRSYFYVPRGPVCDDPHSPALPMLLSAIRDLAGKVGAFMLKIEPQIEDGNQEWLIQLRKLGFRVNPYATHPRRSWMIDVTISEDELLANMAMSSRQNIRRAERNKDLVIREGAGQGDRDHFYHLYTDTARRDNFFIHPQSHYDEMFDVFERAGKMKMWLAEYKGVPIAAQVAMICGAVTTSMFSASLTDPQYRKQRPNHPLQWLAMRWAKSQGSKVYDFRAIAEQLEPGTELYGLYTYKRGYGGYSWLSLATHDLVYQPIFYLAYRQALRLKRSREHKQHMAVYHARQAEKTSEQTQEG